MPVKPTYPGVYIEEIPSGVRTITGVATSIALFVGRAKQGPLDTPVLCLNFTDFARVFSTDARYGDLPLSVRAFYDNGGGRCYVVRIAKGATAATVTLKGEDGTEVLTLTAKDSGVGGESIRAAVTYSGPQPEATFNLELFRWVTDAKGQPDRQDPEFWPNLSMDPKSSRYAPDLVSQKSRLVTAASTVSPPPAAATGGYSQSGRPVESVSESAFVGLWKPLLGGSAGRLRISVDGAPFKDVSLAGIDFSATGVTTEQGLAQAIQAKINSDLSLSAGTVEVSFVAGPNATPSPAPATATKLLRIGSDNADVIIEPAPADDLAVPLMLGTARGGLEVSRYAARRPAPTGIVSGNPATALVVFAELRQDLVTAVVVAGQSVSVNLTTVGAGSPMFKDAYGSSQTNHSDGVREKLELMAKAVNDAAIADPNFKWRAEVWGLRLAFIPTGGADNAVATPVPGLTGNVRYYSVGPGGVGDFQTPGPAASDGTDPGLAEYRAAYDVVDREVDLFNLLVLPKDAGHDDAKTASLWGPASIFCQQRRAFLIMDAPATWTNAQQPISPSTPINVNTLRVGLVKDHSAVFYPRLLVNDDGAAKAVYPSGAIAGLMARIDAGRGVWKAPAGTEADIRGIVGLERRFSDLENGVLNPQAVNTIRMLPNGIVNWGARTMDGSDDFGSEYKYIPVRRLALFLEESLYRGTQWVVFEPNDEPLWAQIRLNVGAFMNTLFRQGAFQGTTPREAYFVKCDKETTTQNDINLGIVNILVGFAPLKPAEFVVIQLRQMAGQIQV
jgi:Bacteriophage tail sheath protein